MIRVVIVAVRPEGIDVDQADQMVKPKRYASPQMQALNPALVMILIPFNNLVPYPALRRWGVAVTPLRRMGYDIAFSGFAWIASGAIQLAIDDSDAVSYTWQVVPDVLLTFG
jgi:POT family proton-dependent oligopeptide transporter